MKSGLTIDELSTEVLRQNSAKQDYLVKTGNLQMESFGGSPYLRLIGDDDVDLVEPLDIKSTAHSQFSSYLDIPIKYYNRMLAEHPDLLVKNVNSWLARKSEQKMVRTLDGAARALVSNRYRRIDHLDILQAVLPIIGRLPDAIFESCEITDTRMYIKVVNPRLQMDVTPGDTVQAALSSPTARWGLAPCWCSPWSTAWSAPTAWLSTTPRPDAPIWAGSRTQMRISCSIPRKPCKRRTGRLS